jgi:hypothetical protein
MRRIFVGSVFGVPLHAQQPTVRMLNRLHQTVGRPADRNESVAEKIKTLMMERRTRDHGCSQGLVHLGMLCDLDVVQRIVGARRKVAWPMLQSAL